MKTQFQFQNHNHEATFFVTITFHPIQDPAVILMTPNLLLFVLTVMTFLHAQREMIRHASNPAAPPIFYFI
jgi:hypothetical protein